MKHMPPKARASASATPVKFTLRRLFEPDVFLSVKPSLTIQEARLYPLFRNAGFFWMLARG